MRNSKHLVEMALHEIEVSGSLDELFASGTTLRLARLALTECVGSSVIDGLVALAISRVADSLEELDLDIADHADHVRALSAILGSPRFAKLTSLRVGSELDHATDALREGPAWPSLRELVVSNDLSGDARNRLTVALKQRAFSSLARVQIGDLEQHWLGAQPI